MLSGPLQKNGAFQNLGDENVVNKMSNLMKIWFFNHFYPTSIMCGPQVLYMDGKLWK